MSDVSPFDRSAVEHGTAEPVAVARRRFEGAPRIALEPGDARGWLRAAIEDAGAEVRRGPDTVESAARAVGFDDARMLRRLRARAA